jgi:hypothetical protein
VSYLQVKSLKATVHAAPRDYNSPLIYFTKMTKAKLKKQPPKKKVKNSNSDNSSGLAIPLENADLPPVLEKLAAGEPGDRVWAYASITNLMENPINRKLLFSKGLISNLIQRISLESHPEAIVEVLGACRNVIVHAPDVSAEFISKGVLSSAESQVPNLRTLIELELAQNPPSTPQEEDARLFVHSITSNLLELFSALW